MDCPARIVTTWSDRHAAHLVIDGPSGDDVVTRLDSVLNRLLVAGVTHLVVNLHGPTGGDVGVLQLLASTSHGLRAQGGEMQVNGLRRRLVSRSEVGAFPEFFGDVSARA